MIPKIIHFVDISRFSSRASLLGRATLGDLGLTKSRPLPLWRKAVIFPLTVERIHSRRNGQCPVLLMDEISRFSNVNIAGLVSQKRLNDAAFHPVRVAGLFAES